MVRHDYLSPAITVNWLRTATPHCPGDTHMDSLQPKPPITASPRAHPLCSSPKTIAVCALHTEAIILPIYWLSSPLPPPPSPFPRDNQSPSLFCKFPCSPPPLLLVQPPEGSLRFPQVSSFFLVYTLRHVFFLRMVMIIFCAQKSLIQT